MHMPDSSVASTIVLLCEDGNSPRLVGTHSLKAIRQTLDMKHLEIQLVLELHHCMDERFAVYSKRMIDATLLYTKARHLLHAC